MAKEPFTDGVPELLLLRLLSRKEMYGYELVAEIRAASGEVFAFGEGCVYPILHRLVGERCLKLRTEQVSGRPRRYYRLSAKGEKRLSKLESAWETVVEGVANFGKEVAHAEA